MSVEQLVHEEALVVSEATPVSTLLQSVRRRSASVVVLQEQSGKLRGVVRADLIERVAQRLPHAPVRMLPTQGVLELAGSTTVHEAKQLMAPRGLGAMVFARCDRPGWGLVLREALVD